MIYKSGHLGQDHFSDRLSEDSRCHGLNGLPEDAVRGRRAQNPMQFDQNIAHRVMEMLKEQGRL